jgi:CBS domain-containing protein
MSNKGLEQLTAADCMQREMITIGPKDTLRDALDLMTENHTTGLPVMDRNCRCIGVVSATDILNYEQEHSDCIGDAQEAQHFNPDTQQWETVSLSAFGLEEFGDIQVQDVMARNLISVKASTLLKEVAQVMLDAKIHRVLVMDDVQQLNGVVSALDFVRAVAGK